MARAAATVAATVVEEKAEAVVAGERVAGSEEVGKVEVMEAEVNKVAGTLAAATAVATREWRQSLRR